jgi:hypothetical protein
MKTYYLQRMLLVEGINPTGRGDVVFWDKPGEMPGKVFEFVGGQIILRNP